MLPKLVVFDMAGTTVQDGGEVPAAFLAALAEHQVQVTPEQVNAVRGASKRQAIWQLVPDGADRDARAERAYASFKAQLARRFAAGVRAIPGAAETFAWLRQRSVRVALNTGFDRDIATLLVEALGWSDNVGSGKNTVDAIVCGDEVSQGRPAPLLIFRCMEATGVLNVHEVAAVGDTALDLQAGHHAGVRWNIGVLSGAHRRAQLEAQPHTHLLESVGELPALWSSDRPEVEPIRGRDVSEESFDWGTLKWLSSAALSSAAQQTLGVCQILPGRRNPVHYHPNCEEVLYMLSGSGRHSLDGRHVSLSGGDVLRIPAGVRHNLENVGAEPISCVIAFSTGRRETIWCE